MNIADMTEELRGLGCGSGVVPTNRTEALLMLILVELRGLREALRTDAEELRARVSLLLPTEEPPRFVSAEAKEPERKRGRK